MINCSIEEFINICLCFFFASSSVEECHPALYRGEAEAAVGAAEGVLLHPVVGTGLEIQKVFHKQDRSEKCVLFNLFVYGKLCPIAKDDSQCLKVEVSLLILLNPVRPL